MAPRTPAPKPGLIMDGSLPMLSQTASVAIALLKAAGCGTWAELVAETPEGEEYRQKVASKVQITEDQASWLDLYTYALSWLNMDTKPATTIAVCPTCEEFTVTTTTDPTQCRMTMGCEGKPKRVSAARRTNARKPKKTAQAA